MMNWKGFGRNCPGLILRYYPGIRLEELRKSTKTLSQVSGSRFEAVTSEIRSRIFNQSTKTLSTNYVDKSLVLQKSIILQIHCINIIASVIPNLKKSTPQRLLVLLIRSLNNIMKTPVAQFK
jgi:hypothetical protein